MKEDIFQYPVGKIISGVNYKGLKTILGDTKEHTNLKSPCVINFTDSSSIVLNNREEYELDNTIINNDIKDFLGGMILSVSVIDTTRHATCSDGAKLQIWKFQTTKGKDLVLAFVGDKEHPLVTHEMNYNYLERVKRSLHEKLNELKNDYEVRRKSMLNIINSERTFSPITVALFTDYVRDHIKRIVKENDLANVNISDLQYLRRDRFILRYVCDFQRDDNTVSTLYYILSNNKSELTDKEVVSSTAVTTYCYDNDSYKILEVSNLEWNKIYRRHLTFLRTNQVTPCYKLGEK